MQKGGNEKTPGASPASAAKKNGKQRGHKQENTRIMARPGTKAAGIFRRLREPDRFRVTDADFPTCSCCRFVFRQFRGS
ncbi:MAG: hypothetical protein C6P37_10150 [Caldibacillus debilis]|uniref:Uncharacterized protein n=1 Tax=Caldibacillus debilis TaxID=301148 RepID=A0A3E0K3D6_9BACI|nr:MAG: hypothetical protein C6P37_10150 [Caldibacillus debilis]REJ27977.1 MAG: hypothetical protein C6W56_09300 [Caldibacillus debilis]